MKKLLSAITISLLTAGLAIAASSINFDNKTFSLKHTKTFGNNSTLEIYLPENASANNFSSGILKGVFSIQDTQNEKFKEEMDNSAKEISSEPVKYDEQPIWTKMDMIDQTTYIVATCVSLGNLMQRVSCSYNKSQIINNNSSMKMFIYAKEYNLGSSSNVGERLNTEYQKLKPEIISE